MVSLPEYPAEHVRCLLAFIYAEEEFTRDHVDQFRDMIDALEILKFATASALDKKCEKTPDDVPVAAKQEAESAALPQDAAYDFDSILKVEPDFYGESDIDDLSDVNFFADHSSNEKCKPVKRSYVKKSRKASKLKSKRTKKAKSKPKLEEDDEFCPRTENRGGSSVDELTGVAEQKKVPTSLQFSIVLSF